MRKLCMNCKQKLGEDEHGNFCDSYCKGVYLYYLLKNNSTTISKSQKDEAIHYEKCFSCGDIYDKRTTFMYKSKSGKWYCEECYDGQ